jgi:tetratricopeptide (TPR) repeat protein
VFSRAKQFNSNQEIDEAEKTIPADEFLGTKAYQDFLHFKEIKNFIRFMTHSSANLSLSTKLEEAFKASNPESYYTWQILGDFYKSKHHYSRAVTYYEKALEKEIATLKEKREIELTLQICKEEIKAGKND